MAKPKSGRALRALASLDVRENLSIEGLCQLARSMDMGNAQQLTREVINESIGAEEERARTLKMKSTTPMLFLRAAFKASAPGRALDTLIDDARALRKAKV
ncbi:MAG: hypothetical protein WA747_10535 [Steroidobacteraceae bacterium]